MIIAAGLTPAWQQIVVLDRLRPGEVNRARSVDWCASGKVLNVGLALHRLGGGALTIAPLGGPQGAAIAQEFSAAGAPARWVDSSAPTRVCTTILQHPGGPTTELVENARPLSDDDLQRFFAVYCDVVSRADCRAVVLAGSLPAGTPVGFYRDLLQPVACPAVLDVRGPELWEALPLRPLLVKPNAEELGHTLGRPLEDEPALLTAMDELIRRGAQAVLISRGARPALLRLAQPHHGQSVYTLEPPAIDVVNPIGCGDCLAAGVATAIAAGQPLIEAVRYGMGAAVENALHLLPAILTPERVAQQAAQVRVATF